MIISLKFFKKDLEWLSLPTGLLAAILLVTGLSMGLNGPADYQQGDMVKIMYVHVPSAWMALGIYSFMAICSFIFVVWRNQLFDLLANKAAPIGATFAFITLVTGSLWGKPIWGTWWVWDARLTSMLILFFFYLGYMILSSSLQNELNKSDAPAVLSIIGFINVPIVKFSVEYWTSLHQKSSVFRLDGPTIHTDMLLPLLLVFIGCICLFINILILKVRTELYRKKYLRRKLILYK